ncbi:hypothetical protein [Rhodococcus ruber]|uniref:hypothetical protein n=1 Tax=Rhodococcus ruber TaxID=1830 RepID=UPI0037838123
MNDPTPLRRADLLASGHTPTELRNALRTGRLRRIAPGIYLRRHETDGLDDVDRHRLRVQALAPALDADAVFSHVSAAVLHGFDLWNVDLSRVHVTRGRTSGGRRTPHLHVHVGGYGADEIATCDGLPVTSAARTVVDLARTLPSDRATVIGDSALRLRRVDPGALSVALATAGTKAGIASARRVVPFLDGRSESPGESLSRLRMRDAGMPRPQLQHELRTGDGRFVARTDFHWEGIAGEFDGMGKYGADEPGATAEIVRREKLREDAIRQLGLEVIRWTWPDLFRFHVVQARFGQAAQRARR